MLETQKKILVEKYINMLQNISDEMKDNLDEHLEKLTEFIEENQLTGSELWLKLQYNKVAYSIEDEFAIDILN